VPDVEPAYGAGPLLLIAAAAVAVLLFLIMKLRLHAFVALVLVSLLTAIATQIPLSEVVNVLLAGFGSTLASVGLLVGLGAMIGKLLEVTGGANVLADTLVNRFGAAKAPLALGIASLLFGFPIFFDAGFVVFLPIILSVAKRFGGSVLTYALPAAGAFAVMHAFVPPHPGPVGASDILGADIGLVVIVGLLIAVPTWFLGSYLYSRWAGERFYLPLPSTFDAGPEGGERDDRDDLDEPAGSGGTAVATRQATGVRAPAFSTVLILLLLPLVLILLNTGISTLATAGVVDGDTTTANVLKLIGQTPIALLITTLVAMWVLGRERFSRGEVEHLVNSSLGPVCAIILVTGAGGMFGGVLRSSGIGQALSDSLQSVGLPVIVAAFIIATALRVAQGSATVALTTTAGLISPVMAEANLSSIDTALVVVAIAAGSTVLSHVNDSGFWLVGRFLEMDEKTTLKTWTVMETLLGTIGFVIALVVSLFV
jgi:GntP family gluconate:H+ symporter